MELGSWKCQKVQCLQQFCEILLQYLVRCFRECRFHICVDNEPQAADLKIVNLARPGDIIVTQDWGLAAMLLGKKAVCLSPTGSVYEPGKMDFLLEEREVKAKLRRNGKRTKGPRPRSLADDQRFAASLAQLLEQSI